MKNAHKILLIPAMILVACGFLAGRALGAPSTQTQKAAGPDAVVQAFYKYHFSHDMGFEPETVKQRSAWLTPELLEACKAYFATPQDPNEAPDIEGDMFTGSQEYPDTFSVGTAHVTGEFARVAVKFGWKEGNSTQGTVVLIQQKGKWLIDNVEFGDEESLRQVLKENTAQSRPRR